MTDIRVDGITKAIGVGLLIAMFAILALVTYSVLKPPIVNKETIDALVKTANSTEQYVKELREMAYQNKLETDKDNSLLDSSGKDREGNYKDLYNKYGIVQHEDFYASNAAAPDITFVTGLQFENHRERRQQLSADSK